MRNALIFINQSFYNSTMKNSTFLVIVCWSVLWSLITMNYFSTVKLGLSDIVNFLIQHGFEILIVLYGITGIVVNYALIREEFRLKNKYRPSKIISE